MRLATIIFAIAAFSAASSAAAADRDVLRHGQPNVAVAVGDSITAGGNADRRWTDALGRTLGKAWRIVNAGVDGNTAVWPSKCFGVPAVKRLRRDALAEPNLGAVIVMVGVNDLLQPRIRGGDCTVSGQLDPTELENAYRSMAAEIKAEGAQALIATIAPFGGFELWSPEVERERERINHWLRTAGIADAVIDLDAVLAEPDDPSRLRKSYDSGDGLHPSDAGAEAIAAEVARLLLSLAPQETVDLPAPAS